LKFTIAIPKGAKAKVVLPGFSAGTRIVINNKVIQARSIANDLVLELDDGDYSGEAIQ
jgi:hypothetical protein